MQNSTPVKHRIWNRQKSEKVDLFPEAAEFIDVELEQHPEDGKDAEIVCRVRGDPSLEIFWQFEGRNILEGLIH